MESVNTENNQVANFKNLFEIPIEIKSIPEFNGDPAELQDFILTVREALSLNQKFKNTPFYSRMLNYICLVKLKGDAAKIIAGKRIEADWNEIESTLIECFEDCRSLETLLVQINYSRQGHKSIKEFFDEIKQLSLYMSQKISTDSRFVQSMLF